MDEKADEYDSPWKDVLRRLFPQFLDFFFPAVYAAIDWTQKPEFLDKELHKSVPEAVTRNYETPAKPQRRQEIQAETTATRCTETATIVWLS